MDYSCTDALLNNQVAAFPLTRLNFEISRVFSLSRNQVGIIA